MQNLTAADCNNPQRDLSPLITAANYLLMAVTVIWVAERLLEIRQQHALTLLDWSSAFLCIIPYLLFFAGRTVIRKAVQKGIISEKGAGLCDLHFRVFAVMTSIAITAALRLR